MGDAEPDVIVADVPVDDPVASRTKTAEKPKAGRKITIDLDDADSLADFLLEVSRLVRDRKRISVTIE